MGHILSHIIPIPGPCMFHITSFGKGSEYTIYDINLQDPNSFRASSTAHHGRPPPLTAALEASLRNYNAHPSSEQP